MSSSRFRSLGVLLFTLVAVTISVGDDRAVSRPLPLEQRLKKQIDFDFQNTPFAEVIETLSRKSGIEIVIDKQALDEAGIAMDTPISMKVDRIAFKSALNLTLHQVGAAYTTEGEKLLITTLEHLQGALISRDYPVADLLGKPWGGLASNGLTTEAKLIDLITRSIASRSWDDVGGKGTISYCRIRKSIIVNQRQDLHEQIANLFAALRRLHDKEIPVIQPAFTPPIAR